MFKLFWKERKEHLEKTASIPFIVRESIIMLAYVGYRFIITSRVFDTREALLDAALSLASVIASKSPIAVQGSKINLNYARDHTVDDNFTFVVCY